MALDAEAQGFRSSPATPAAYRKPVPGTTPPNTADKSSAAKDVIKKTGISARFPAGLHTDLVAIATATGNSLNGVTEDAFKHYVRVYVGSDDYLERADRWRARLEAAAAALDSNDAAVVPARSVQRGQRAGRPGSESRVVAVVVRVPEAIAHQMRNVTLVLGISLNNVIIEAAELWTAYYPEHDERFRIQVLSAHESFVSSIAHLAEKSPAAGEILAEVLSRSTLD